MSNLNISKLMGLFFTSSNYPKCKLICTSDNLDLKKYPMPNYGWRKQSKCMFDSERRFEIRRIRDIRVRDIESRLYYTYAILNRKLATSSRSRVISPVATTASPPWSFTTLIVIPDGCSRIWYSIEVVAIVSVLVTAISVAIGLPALADSLTEPQSFEPGLGLIHVTLASITSVNQSSKELKIRYVELTLIDTTCVISSRNPVFCQLLESSHRDDSNKWSNIGFGQEITQVE